MSSNYLHIAPRSKRSNDIWVMKREEIDGLCNGLCAEKAWELGA